MASTKRRKTLGVQSQSRTQKASKRTRTTDLDESSSREFVVAHSSNTGRSQSNQNGEDLGLAEESDSWLENLKLHASKGSLGNDFLFHEPNEMFPEPSSTVINHTATQQRFLGKALEDGGAESGNSRVVSIVLGLLSLA